MPPSTRAPTPTSWFPRVAQARVHHQVRVAYVRVVEYQRRGLVHLHVVIRLDRAMPKYRADEMKPPSERFNVELLEQAVRAAVAAVDAPVADRLRERVRCAAHGAQGTRPCPARRRITARRAPVTAPLLRDRPRDRRGRVSRAFCLRETTTSADPRAGGAERSRMEGRVTLDPDDVEAIARRVAELVGRPWKLVDAQTVAAELRVDRDWVYAHARQLGAVRLGPAQRRACGSTSTWCASASPRRRRSILPPCLRRIAGCGARARRRSRA
jgi:hypothetical protein